MRPVPIAVKTGCSGMTKVTRKNCEQPNCIELAEHYDSSNGRMCDKHHKEYWKGVDEI